MKVIKKIVIALLVLIAIPLILGLFVNGEYSVVRETTINQSNEVVFSYIKYLKNQDSFSTWAKMDPNMKKGFEGEDGTVGAVASWDSENQDVGMGEQEILKIVEGERIDFELRFLKPFEATDNAYFTTEVIEGNQTLVKWGFNGEMAYPMNLMLLFMDMEEMLGPSLEEGLVGLKTILEEMEVAPTIEITEMEVGAMPILYIEESGTFNSEEIAGKIGGAYGEIMALMSVAQVEMTAPPLAITNDFSMEDMTWVFDCALVGELPEGTELTGRIKSGITYAGKVIKGVHIGSYTESPTSYQAMEKYIKDNGLEQNGRSWEEYVDDPTTVEEAELRTFIYFPIK